MNTKYITRSVPNTIDELEKLMDTIPNHYLSYHTSDRVSKIFDEYRILLNNCEKEEDKEKKIENIKILFNNLVFVDKFHFIFKNKAFRLAVFNKIKYLIKYDKSFYMYIPYVYTIFELVKQNKHFY